MLTHRKILVLPKVVGVTQVIDAGQLREAAEANSDTRQLVHLRGDCIAKGVQYYRGCRKGYIRAALKTEKETPGFLTQEDATYVRICNQVIFTLIIMKKRCP